MLAKEGRETCKLLLLVEVVLKILKQVEFEIMQIDTDEAKKEDK